MAGSWNRFRGLGAVARFRKTVRPGHTMIKIRTNDGMMPAATIMVRKGMECQTAMMMEEHGITVIRYNQHVIDWIESAAR